jgi:hypothetical protein
MVEEVRAARRRVAKRGKEENVCAAEEVWRVEVTTVTVRAKAGPQAW